MSAVGSRKSEVLCQGWICRSSYLFWGSGQIGTGYNRCTASGGARGGSGFGQEEVEVLYDQRRGEVEPELMVSYSLHASERRVSVRSSVLQVRQCRCKCSGIV